MNRLAELRREAKISQLTAAKIACVTREAYSRYENGIRIPPVEVLAALADYYKTSIDYITGRTDMREALPAPKQPIPTGIKELSELVRTIVRQELAAIAQETYGQSSQEA